MSFSRDWAITPDEPENAGSLRAEAYGETDAVHPDEIDVVPDEVDYALSDLDSQMSKVRALRPLLEAARAVDLAAFGTTWYVDRSGSMVLLNAYVSTHAEIVEIRRRLAAAGFRLQTCANAVCEYPAEALQTHRLAHPAAPGDLLLSVYLTGGVKACRYVQVGVQTKEVPVYELRCDEPAPAAEAAP